DGKAARGAAAHAARAGLAGELFQVLVEEYDAHPAALIAAVDRDRDAAARGVRGLVGGAGEVDAIAGAVRVDAVGVAAIAGGGGLAVAGGAVAVVEVQGRPRLWRPERHCRKRDR